jgi:hypothetical protein
MPILSKKKAGEAFVSNAERANKRAATLKASEKAHKKAQKEAASFGKSHRSNGNKRMNAFARVTENNYKRVNTGGGTRKRRASSRRASSRRN